MTLLSCKPRNNLDPMRLERSSVTKTPRWMTAIGIFLLFGALMASLAGATLVFPGTALDRMRDLSL
jgi:hypothetical protein